MTETIIFGLDLSVELYDRLSLKYANDLEPHLMLTKWWDYRFLNPVAATYIYAHHYAQQYTFARRRFIDYKVESWQKAWKHFDIFKCPPAQITAAWRGRQIADAMGIPYDLYIRWAFDARMRYWQRSVLPTASQLYSQMVTDQVQEKWNDHLKGVLMHGAHAGFKNENYQRLPVQEAHHEWLFEQAAKRENIGYALAEIFDAGLLPVEKINAKYGAVVVAKVCRAA